MSSITITDEDDSHLRRERFVFWIRTDHGFNDPPKLFVDQWAIESRATTRSKWVAESIWKRLSMDRSSRHLLAPAHPPLTNEIKARALAKLLEVVEFVEATGSGAPPSG